MAGFTGRCLRTNARKWSEHRIQAPDALVVRGRPWSVHSLTRMHVFSGLRRLGRVGCRSRGRAGPWVRQSRTFGPGRSSAFAIIEAQGGPPLMSAPRACPPPSPHTALRAAQASTPKPAPPVGARLRAINQQGGDAAPLADTGRTGPNARWQRGFTQRRGHRQQPLRWTYRNRACRTSSRNGINASLAYRAQACSYRAQRAYRRRAACPPAIHLIVGCAGGQALGADMSGGPPRDSRFAVRVPTARSEGPRLAAPRACPSAPSSTRQARGGVSRWKHAFARRMNRFKRAGCASDPEMGDEPT